MKTVFCIINPRSGTQKTKNFIEQYCRKYFREPDFSLEFAYTKYAGHAGELSKNAANKFDYIIAIGGDGTIHEVAQHIVHSNSTLGIIPMGSGNGLARFLGISLQPEQAIQQCAQGITTEIDSISCNNEYFLNVAGIGFDAYIGELFNNQNIRGGFRYFKIILQEFLSYKSNTLHFSFAHKSFSKDVFLVAIANSSQWGLNAHVSPLSDIQDGKFEIIIFKKPNLLQAIKIGIRLFVKTLHKCGFVTQISTEHVIIENKNNLPIHLDGEIITTNTTLEFTLHHKSLKILLPR